MGSDRNIDARFIDGGYADAPTLALTLGLYQTRENGDLDTVLNLLWPLTSLQIHISQPTSELISIKILHLVNTCGLQKKMEGLAQFFQINHHKYLEQKWAVISLLVKRKPLITTALISTTTIENPVFKTKAGQKVEILLIALNSKVPTAVIGME